MPVSDAVRLRHILNAARNAVSFAPSPTPRKTGLQFAAHSRRQEQSRSFGAAKTGPLLRMTPSMRPVLAQRRGDAERNQERTWHGGSVPVWLWPEPSGSTMRLRASCRVGFGRVSIKSIASRAPESIGQVKSFGRFCSFP